MLKVEYDRENDRNLKWTMINRNRLINRLTNEI